MAKSSSTGGISSCIAAVAVMMMLMAVVVVVRGQTTMNPEIQECASTLYTLSPCLLFVGGKSDIPTPDCCTAMGKVVDVRPKCLCVLIKDHDDPVFDSFYINISYAVQLPTKCNNAKADINKCPGLLGLNPDSPDAKIFKDYSNNSTKPNGSTSTPTSPSPTAPISPPPQAGGATGMRSNGLWWFELVLATGIWMYFTSLLQIL